MIAVLRRIARMPLALTGAAGLALAASLVLAPARADPDGGHSAETQLRRLTEAQYRSAIADVFGPYIKVVGRFEPDLRVDGLLAAGTSAVAVSPGGFEQYETLARGVATQVTDELHRDRLVGCAPGPADPQGVRCAGDFIRRVGLRLYRRPVSAPEAARFTAAAMTAARTLGGDFHGGLAAALAGVLSSPEFLFRVDLPAPSGREIDAWSKATRLSFLLWDAIPDEALLAAAASGELDTPAGRERQVARMIASPRFKQGVRAFFADFLRLDTMDTLSKDGLIYPAFTGSVAAETREQTLRTITYLLIDRQGDYRDLFTSRSLAMNRALGPIYDIPVASRDWYIHEFPEGDPRTGLLTQASLLALHSHPGRTSPTLRGVALTETLLCEKVPSPPANVNFAVVQDVNNPTLKTTRARLQAHLDDEECASCHKRTDPMGLGLEQFDGAGQFRRIEHGEPIDVSGQFEKKTFDGAAQLGQLFHDSPQVSACLARTAWRYAHGRSPAAADEANVTALSDRFAAQGYRIAALMRTIALDPTFYAMPGGATHTPRTMAGRAGAKGEAR